jgi:hypothetical protein
MDAETLKKMNAERERHLKVFNAVTEKMTDWRAPIDVRLSMPKVEGLGGPPAIADAVRYFTATEVKFTKYGTSSNTAELRIQSVGYRAGPAGDN